MPARALNLATLGVPLGGAQTYIQKLLSYAPIAYWPMHEAAGSAAVCQVNALQNGTYTGVTLANALGPDGVNSAPLFDATNDYVDVYSATFNTAANKAEGTVFIWAKVNSVGVWSDGSNRKLFEFLVDSNNYVEIQRRGAVATQLQYQYRAGGTSKSVLYATSSPITWFSAAITWSKSTGASGEVKAYFNGAQVGSTQTGLGTWVGNFAAVRTLIGAATQTPSAVWHGWLAHCAVWDSPLTADQLAAIHTV